MSKGYQKESYRIFYAWLALAAISLFLYAGLEDQYAFTDAAMHVGVICFVLLDLLFVLILVKDSAYWIPDISYAWAHAAGSAARRKCELVHLGLFLLATFLYLFYCYGPHEVRISGSITDSMAAAALICAAGYLAKEMVPAAVK